MSVPDLVRGPISRGTYRGLECEIEPLLYPTEFYLVYRIDCWRGFVHFDTAALRSVDTRGGWQWVLAELDAALRRAACAAFFID